MADRIEEVKDICVEYMEMHKHEELRNTIL